MSWVIFLASALAATAPNAAYRDPLDLFVSACMDGSATLKLSDIEPVVREKAPHSLISPMAGRVGNYYRVIAFPRTYLAVTDGADKMRYRGSCRVSTGSLHLQVAVKRAGEVFQYAGRPVDLGFFFMIAAKDRYVVTVNERGNDVVMEVAQLTELGLAELLDK